MKIYQKWLLLEKKEAWKANFAKHVSVKPSVASSRLEFDLYIEEERLLDDENFDILGWWKANGLKYPIMQKIARDFLAIPISTVASESSFSTSGRILTHRSKLCPSNFRGIDVCPRLAMEWCQT